MRQLPARIYTLRTAPRAAATIRGGLTEALVVSFTGHLDLSRRLLEPEIMDSASLDEAEHRAALRGLARINTLSLSARRVWREIRRTFPAGGRSPIRVLDLACGGGDLAEALSRLSDGSGRDLRVAGCDRSPVAVRHARERAGRSRHHVRFFEIDVLSAEMPAGYDVISSCLFLHHLSDDEAVELLRRMSEGARRLVVVQDLIRCWSGYALAHLGVRALTRSAIVHADGPQSVLASVTLAEARSLARRAGLSGARVRRCWPQRFCLTWEVP